MPVQKHDSPKSEIPQSDTSGSGNAATLAQLQERYRQLNERKIAAETEHRGAKKRLEELQAEALAKYGTDDLAELQRKLAEIKADNENKRAKYQADLEKIEGDLAAVEQQFDTASTAPDAPLAKRS